MIKLVAAVAIAASLSATVANAEPVWQVGQGYVVRHQDLDLTSTAGQRTLLHRVEQAAGRACAGYMLRVDERACREAVISQALAHSAPAARQALQLAIADRATQTLASR